MRLNHSAVAPPSMPLDLKKFDEIDQLGAAYISYFGKLDILVASAATLGVLTPVSHTDPHVWEDADKLNLTSNYHLIRSLDPLLPPPVRAALFSCL